MSRMRSLLLAVFLTSLASLSCSSAPGVEGLRDSFARQLAANTFISEFRRDGNTMTFRGPRPDGTPAEWRVQIDSATVEPQNDPRQPYKGTIKSSWSVSGEKIEISGGDSNLPIELTSNGLSQDCWAFWLPDTKTWSWE